MKKAKQLILIYKNIAVSHDLYTLEYTKDGEEVIEQYTGSKAFQKAVIKAEEEKINGFICYPLTRNRIFIVDGVLRKRGRKPRATDRRTTMFVEEIPSASMKAIQNFNDQFIQ